MNTIMRVDAHHHVGDLTVRDQPSTTGLPPLRAAVFGGTAARAYGLAPT